jgi:hypothetical protein
MLKHNLKKTYNSSIEVREPQKHNKKKKPDEKDTEKVSDITKNPTSGNFIDVRL